MKKQWIAADLTELQDAEVFGTEEEAYEAAGGLAMAGGDEAVVVVAEVLYQVKANVEKVPLEE